MMTSQGRNVLLYWHVIKKFLFSSAISLFLYDRTHNGMGNFNIVFYNADF